MHKLFFMVIIFFSNISFGLAREPADRHKLIIASFLFPPLLHSAQGKSFSGTMGETVKYICKYAKISCEFEIVPLKRAYVELTRGHADALITLDLGQFKDCCSTSTWYAPWSAGLFAANSNNIPEKAEQIYGKGLIVVNGMRSPYSFLPNLDALAENGTIKLHKALEISSAVLMFQQRRADLLWGGEDFKWYLKKLTPNKEYHYKPLMRKNVVLWTQNYKQETLRRFNEASIELMEQNIIGPDGLLIPEIMSIYYKEHILKKTK